MLILINVGRQLVTYSTFIHTGILLPGVCPTSSSFIVVTPVSAFPEWCFKINTLYCHTAVIMSVITTVTHTAGFHPLMCKWLIRRARRSDITAQLQSLIRSPLTVSHMRHAADLTAGNFHTSSRNQGGDGSYWKTSAAVQPWLVLFHVWLFTGTVPHGVNQQQTKYKHVIQIKINRQTNRIYIYASLHVS